MVVFGLFEVVEWCGVVLCVVVDVDLFGVDVVCNVYCVFVVVGLYCVVEFVW